MTRFIPDVLPTLIVPGMLRFKPGSEHGHIAARDVIHVVVKRKATFNSRVYSDFPPVVNAFMTKQVQDDIAEISGAAATGNEPENN